MTAAARKNIVFILFPFGALGADSVEHGILRAEGEPVVLEDMLRDLVEKAALDMEQLPALGAFEMIVVAAVRAVADILIARAFPVVEHELAHTPLAQHFFKMAIDSSFADRAAALAQNMRYILGGQMPAAAAFKQIENEFALLCVVTHKKHLFELRQKTEEIFRRKLNLRIVFNFNPESAVCQERSFASLKIVQ